MYSSFPVLTLTICLKKTKEMPMHQLLVPWSNLYTCDFFLRCSGTWGESDSIFFIPWCDWQQILLHTFIICKNSKMVLLQRRAWQVIKINVKEQKKGLKKPTLWRLPSALFQACRILNMNHPCLRYDLLSSKQLQDKAYTENPKF